MYERLTNDQLREMLCIWDDRNPECQRTDKIIFGKSEPCGECANCDDLAAEAAHELLERREADATRERNADEAMAVECGKRL